MNGLKPLSLAGHTIFIGLFQSMTQHAVYHSGQIALLKKMSK